MAHHHKEIVIAIDGPAGVGKSSVAKGLALKLKGWSYLDTGAMYRAITWAWIQAGQEEALLADPTWLAGLDLNIEGTQVSLNATDITLAIRNQEVTRLVSQVAAAADVRFNLTRMQQEMGRRRPCIVDGRDIGTVVFPQAFLKVFLIASPEVRAKRRWLQLGGEQAPVSIEALIEDLNRRDTYDSTRRVAPLKAAEDAWHLDTDPYDQEQVIALIHEEALKRLALLSV